MKAVRLAPLFVSLALVASFSRAARAAEPETCSVAYARGQEERLAGRLFNARAAFQQCASAGCSTSLASDCSRWVSEVEADLPTIRVAIHDEHGAAVATSKLFIDGIATPLAALSAPIVLEAGPHELRVEAPGYQPVRLETALRPSDREVAVAVTLRPPQPPRRDTSADQVPTAAWVLAGVGTAALGGSIYFGIRANNEYHDLKQRCAPACEPSASDGMYTKAVISDVALAASVVAFAASAIVYFTRATKPPTVALSVAPASQGGRVRVVLSF
jgi:PEGA domain